MTIRPAAALALAATLAAPATAQDRRFMLTGFEAVRVEGPYEVVVTTGRSPAAVATGDPRAFAGLDVTVESRTLVVRSKIESRGGFPETRRTAPRLAVTVPAVRAASVRGGGKLSIDRMVGQQVDVDLLGAGTITVARVEADRVNGGVVGSGSITLGGRAQRGRFQANGAATIDAAALQLDALQLDWLSVGEARFTARRTAEISAEGQGPVIVDGAAACKVSGAGPVECGNMRRR